MKKRKVIQKHCFILSLFLSLTVFSLLHFPPASLADDDSVCAQVKIEIRQEMTLERQAFDAHMRINNGLTHITLENVNVEVDFADEEGNSVQATSDPSDTTALFFIRLDSMENIDNVDGSGTVSPSSSADIHWLIIPAPGASNGLLQGALYYVGAALTYTIGGEEHVTRVTPDYIFVKPMPLIILDYFLPTDVYGDDAFTQEIEPVIPFSLGVRARNSGAGTAKNLKIDSAQPEIVENEQGLLIGFMIEGCQVNGQEAIESLLVDFGDIEPNTSGVARWIMSCSLSGQFVDFEAEYSHSNELGGELTSLLEEVNTHFLVHDVLVDLPGRDDIGDFLAKDGEVFRVYESDSVDTEVFDQSSFSTFYTIGSSGTQIYYLLSTPITAGFMYVQLPDPYNGEMVLKEVVRSDGKRIRAENAWLSKTRNQDHTWQHFIHLFEVNTTDSYTVVFENAAQGPHAPVLQFIPNRTREEGGQLSFIVEASDQDGTIPLLSATPLPALAAFTDQGNGIGIFDWTPITRQAGQYEITFTASDGLLKDAQDIVLTINSLNDTDGDGLPDDWEMDHFNTLDRDGSSDYDGDGASDLEEYLNDTDPTTDFAPTLPVIYSPRAGEKVAELAPVLAVINSIDLDGDPITYAFEVYEDPEMAVLTAGAEDIPETEGLTQWAVPIALDDNTWYYWRVKAADGKRSSLWAYGIFMVNRENDAPGDFFISSPSPDSEVTVLNPVLQVTNSRDPDEDALTYAFEVYEDSSLVKLVASSYGTSEGENGATSWTVDIALTEGTWYYWVGTATDEHGAATMSDLASFYVNVANHAPAVPTVNTPANGSEVDSATLTLIVNNATDEDEGPLSYTFEIDTVNTFDIGQKFSISSLPEGLDTTSWEVPTDLNDNTFYYWRAKANDGFADSPWMPTASFLVNTINDPPTVPVLRNPSDRGEVWTLTPTLSLNRSADSDYDYLTYEYEVYGDANLIELIDRAADKGTTWTISVVLDMDKLYYWRARCKDAHEAVSAWMPPALFFINEEPIDSEYLADGDEDGYSPIEGDCDDADPNSYPWAPELCDGKDNDCDGESDNGLSDADGDKIGDACDICPDFYNPGQDEHPPIPVIESLPDMKASCRITQIEPKEVECEELILTPPSAKDLCDEPVTAISQDLLLKYADQNTPIGNDLSLLFTDQNTYSIIDPVPGKYKATWTYSDNVSDAVQQEQTVIFQVVGCVGENQLFNTIQAGIDAAGSGEKVQISEGDYSGTQITMKDGVSLEGGWDPNFIEWDFKTYKTIISGALVVFIDVHDARIEGLTITNSNNGGIYCLNSSPTIANCIISGNYASLGGGIYCEDSSPLVIRCIIKNNTAENNGGGIYWTGDSHPYIINCLFKNNALTQGNSNHICLNSNASPHTDIQLVRATDTKGITILIYDSNTGLAEASYQFHGKPCGIDHTIHNDDLVIISIPQ